MNAVKKQRIPSERGRVLPLHPQPRKRYPYATTILETALKLLVNGVISAAAIAALGNLIPHLRSHQAKLREIRVQVKESEVKVNQLQEKFTRSFDPSQAKTVMQEQSSRVDPNQRRVVFTRKRRSDRALGQPSASNIQGDRSADLTVRAGEE